MSFFSRRQRAAALSVLASASFGGLAQANPGPASTRAASAQPARLGEALELTEPSTLDRDALVREVLARNPSVGAAQAAVREAQGGVSVASAFEDTHLSYTVAPGSLFSSAPDGHVIRLEQMLPFPGKRGLAEAEADAKVSSARAQALQTRLDLVLEAVRLYDAWFVVHQALSINADHVALLRAFKDSATAQYTAGQATQQDPLQAEVELTHVEHMNVTLAADREVIRVRLNGLLHRPLDTPIAPPPQTLAIPEASERSGQARVDTAVQARPELTAVRAEEGGAKAALALAQRQAWPDFTVMGEYNSMWMDPAHQWMVGVGINLPLFWDRRHGEEQAATARGERLALEQTRLVDQVSTEVEVARLRLTEALHVAHLYRTRLLPAAQDQVAAARASFVVGKTAFGTLIEAERNLRTMSLESVQSLADADLRRAELDRALGQLPAVTPSETTPSGGAR
jgi:outer membrane protein TolC